MTGCARCDWTPGTTPAGVCADCTARVHAALAGHPLCPICARSLRRDEAGVDVGCLGRLRRTLADIGQLWEVLSTPITLAPTMTWAAVRDHKGRWILDDTKTKVLTRHVARDSIGELLNEPGRLGETAKAVTLSATGSAGSDVTVPGGVPAVLRGGGSPNLVLPARPTRREPDGNRDHAVDNRRDDPPSVVAELAGIENAWRHVGGQPAAMTEPTVSGCLTYLRARLGWAVTALEPADVDDLNTQLLVLAGWLRQATGRNDTPIRDQVPCPDCTVDPGHPMWLVYSAGVDGWSDDPSCPRCHRRFSATERALAVGEFLRQQGAA